MTSYREPARNPPGYHSPPSAPKGGTWGDASPQTPAKRCVGTDGRVHAPTTHGPYRCPTVPLCKQLAYETLDVSIALVEGIRRTSCCDVEILS